MRLSLVITCFNEAPHLRASFEAIKKTFVVNHVDCEFIFVDDKSIDSTKAVIESIIKENPSLSFKVILHEANQGRGQSVMDGLRMASAQFVGFLDIDLEIDARYIAPAVELLEDGKADFVMADRLYQFSAAGLIRTIISRGYNLLVRALLRLPFRDTEAGFKFFNREKILPVLNLVQDRRWFWDTEIVACAFKKGLKIILLPVVFIRKPEKQSTVKIFRDSWNYFVSLLAFRKRYLS